MDDDYFGPSAELANPDDEDDDVANDLTFGNTNDIVAGDPDSEVAWKPGHMALAEQIEREKEQLAKRDAAAQHAHEPPTAVRVDESTALQAHYQHAMQQQLMQHHRQHHAHQLHPPHVATQSAPDGPPAPRPGEQRLGDAPVVPELGQRAPLDAPAHVQPAPGASNGAGTMQHPEMEKMRALHRQQLSLMQQQVHQRRLLLYAEQQKIALLQQRSHSAGEVAQLREKQHALAMQDQQLRQAHDHQMRLVIHHQHGQQQQLLHQLHAQFPMHYPASSGQNGDPHHQKGHVLGRGGDLQPQTSPSMSLDQAAAPAQTPNTHAASIHANDVHRAPRAAYPGAQGKTASSGSRNSSAASLPTTALSLEDVERSLAATAKPGPGHSHDEMSHARENRPGGRSNPPGHRGPTGESRSSSSAPAQRHRRRLESMTDRDIEVVLRMHLRQMETAVPYTNEFYAYAMTEKKNCGSEDSFERLAKVVVSMCGSGRGSGSSRSGPKGARPRASENGLPKDSDDNISASSISHTQENLSTLATALGTLQVWNPKAPRKLVDFGGVSRTDTSTEADEKSASATSGAFTPTSGKLLREDDRVVVRSAVEDGYDFIAQIHDVARRKSHAPIDPLIKSLFGVLRLPGGATGVERGFDDAFFVRMCGFVKGKVFVYRAFMLFKPVQKKRTTFCVMRNLHHLIRAERLSSTSRTAGASFWWALSSFVADSSNDAEVVVDVLNNFISGHTNQQESVVCCLASEIGPTLLCAAMQRMLANRSAGLYADDKTKAVGESVGCLCEIVCQALKQIFAESQSSDDVWQVVAMLDALAPEEQQRSLRESLKLLLDNGDAPPPPAA